MDFAGPVLELIKDLWGLASKPLSNIYHLKDNVDLLRNQAEDLKAKSEDVKTRVKCEEEGGGVQCTKQVENWLDKVQEFVGGVDQVLQEAGEHDRFKCLSRCLPRNCKSSYKLGERVDEMLIVVNKLKEEEFNTVTLSLPRPPVLEMPMDETVGLDTSNFDKVWKWLMDEKQVRVIGLYGLGGVGKTTLMKRINNKLSRANHGFEVVIWVVVSRQVNEDSIQDTIRKRLRVKDELWKRWTQNERVNHLYKELTQKKFVLLIDDLWEKLDFPKIGVPYHDLGNGSKIVFTTRSKKVCHQMGAHETSFEVQCLKLKEALELFENNVGEWTIHSHPDIPELAKYVVQECKGLPLALITIGRAMAGIANPHEWKHALTKLMNNPYKMSGMVEDVYPILEFSYHRLNDSNLQHCFLYCCLFPEDYPIRPCNLIGLWIGEGLLGDIDDVYEMQLEGEHVLGRLKMACLLESGRDSVGEYVKMHDVIHDMATWIARDNGHRETKLIVIEKEEDISATEISKWVEAEKVSLWGKWIRNIDQTPPKCSQLETLFVKETKVRLMPRKFFDSMTARLTVLDLSDNRNIRSFPKAICNLINLQYLNMSATRIHELPMEIKNLTRLRCLLLDNILKGILIPTGAITNLPLIVFSQWSFDKRVLQSGQVKEEEMVEELGCMRHLTELSITVFKSSSALNIFQSSNLQRRIRRVWITDRQNNLTNIIISYSPISTGSFSHLEVLYLHDCPVLVKMEITKRIGQAPNYPCFPSLVEVWVYNCEFLDLSWLVHAPKLEEVKVELCNSMEKIIGNEVAFALRLFSNLKSLTLLELPRLMSICDNTLFFPRGASLHIEGCPALRKLPMDSSSVRESFSVYADVDLWAKLEWDLAARVTFQLEEEMTFEKAVRKMTVLSIDWATMEFRPY